MNLGVFDYATSTHLLSLSFKLWLEQDDNAAAFLEVLYYIGDYLGHGDEGQIYSGYIHLLREGKGIMGIYLLHNNYSGVLPQPIIKLTVADIYSINALGTTLQ